MSGFIHSCNLLVVNYCLNLSLRNGLCSAMWVYAHLLLCELLRELNSSRMVSVPIFRDFSSRNSSRIINRRCEWTITAVRRGTMYI